MVEKGKRLNMTDVARPLVSIVIPAFNEQENIDDILNKTYKAVESNAFPYEIIVVDDGSTDRTRELAYQHKVTVLTNGANKGKGVALRRGFGHAQGEIVVTMDADGSHNPEDIPKLLEQVLNGATLVLGTRFGSEEGKQSTKKLNLLGNGFINLSIMLLTGKRITDSQSGFRAMRRSFVRELTLTSDGYEVETEVLVKALKNGNIVKEISLGTSRRKNGHSHLNPLSDGIKIMRTVVKSVIAK
jgi:glycosyltransferase involved in cell wall biosynthesis